VTEPTAQDFMMQVARFSALDRRRTVASTMVACAIWAILAGSSFILVRKARSELAITRDEGQRLAKGNEKLRRDYASLESTSESLQRSIVTLEKRNNELRDLVGKLHGPLPAIVTPELILQEVKGVRHDGAQVYDVLLFIRIPQSRLNEISSVDYVIDHPTKINKVMTSHVSATGFAVSYRGYACFGNVKIEITPVRGEKFTIPYNMCPDWHG
jgi:hypothetical protein